MPRRQVTKFRYLRAVGEEPPWRRQLQGKGGALLLILAGLVLATALYLAPKGWFAWRILATQQAFTDTHWNDMDEVERAWKSLPLLPVFERGDERDIQAFLESQPLAVGVFDRFGQRKLWTRSGDRLIPADPAAKETLLYMNWLAHAEAAQRFDWSPPKDQDPDTGKIATIVLLSDRWLVIKRWKPGDESVERFLRATLRPDARIRVGLTRQTASNHPDDLTTQDWGREPHLQADPYRLATYSPLGSLLNTNAFGEGWQVGCISATAAEANDAEDRIMKQVWIVRFLAFGIGVGALVGFWLRSRARARAMLDADRLASMTHSLKTPLAILKFRCDTLRLGRLSQDQADGELMKLGAEVDQLTLMIENGLRAIRGDQRTGPTRVIDGGWIREVVEDLRPGYEMEGRELDLRLGPEQGKAAPASLRSAVLTLVENALLHGAGKVTVETAARGRRMSIRVLDEGAGLDAAELSVLGKPYQRLRKEGKEGFLHEGQGLGLSLLFQVAEREGWGLNFESAPGEGFAAQLDIQRA
ncbi:MAG TPA: HAMP domain-containing sensor histidine kinase [Holophagaceae bacterium]|jgi:signal transduction histidine kinase|nr:HAMP domain-containing sensor histidine kinase [Holophagaceae bacterium]